MWKEGPVDIKREHIKLSYGNSVGPERDKLEAVAVIAPSKRNVFIVKFILDPMNSRHEEILSEAKKELDFYLVEKKEPDPWKYAIYHCGTAANIYSFVHWAYCPNGEQEVREQ